MQEYAKVPEKSVSLETSTTVNPWGYFPIFYTPWLDLCLTSTPFPGEKEQ